MKGEVVMPQLSLYLDKQMMKKVEDGASASNLSISKYVTLSLTNYFDSNWPLGYEQLFGSIKDDTFEEPKELSFSQDSERELL